MLSACSCFLPVFLHHTKASEPDSAEFSGSDVTRCTLMVLNRQEHTFASVRHYSLPMNILCSAVEVARSHP